MEKLTGMMGQAMGADPGESMEQTMKEKFVEEMIQDKVENFAGAKVANSEQVENIAEKIADVVGDKVPTSMLGAGMAGHMNDDKPASGSGAGAGLLEQASGMFGGAGARPADINDPMGQAAGILGGSRSDEQTGAANDLLGQAASFLGK